MTQWMDALFAVKISPYGECGGREEWARGEAGEFAVKVSKGRDCTRLDRSSQDCGGEGKLHFAKVRAIRS